MVVISNGFHKFHLSVAAAEANERRLLSSFITGAYPTPLIRKLSSLPPIRSHQKLQRLAARAERIPDDLVHAIFTAETLSLLEKVRQSEAARVVALEYYGRQASRHVERAAARGGKIYHYRAGFGGKSIGAAKKCGMFLVCDHSIVHPAVLGPMVRKMGDMPSGQEMATLGRFWEYLQRDIELADAVVVNSRFVADTFEHYGHRRSPVYTVYLGVDDAFSTQVPERHSRQGDLRLLFAGNFEKRKGAEILIDAVAQSSHWRLDVAGPISAELKERSQAFFSNPRVRYLGLLSRKDLALAMTNADVFVFPSFAEGSARVIFEALASGCYVITTPNGGSIVEPGVHGALVPPGDRHALVEAIEYALRHPAEVSEIGKSNAHCIRKHYRQRDYGDRLAGLYKELLHL